MARRWVGIPHHGYGCRCAGCQDEGQRVSERIADDAAYDIDERLAWGGEDVPS